MAEFDGSKLQNIARMVTPAALIGSSAVTHSGDIEFMRSILDVLLNNGANGAKSMSDIIDSLNSLATSKNEDSSSDSLRRFMNTIRVYSTETQELTYNAGNGSKPAWYQFSHGKERQKISMSDIVGSENFATMKKVKKTFGVVLSNSAFISPAMHNAEKAAMFMNYLPSVVASSLTPYLSVEFAFDRTVDQTKLQSASLLRFLLGAATIDTSDNASSANDLMAKLSSTSSKIKENKKDVTLTTMTTGMELFTAPQTLTNLDGVAIGSRYVDILDPMKPLATIESFTVSMTPLKGFYSYKKASLVLRIHDRSRLAELADILRPHSLNRTTTWVTYGWRHPVQLDNPYAQFINGNMLVREAYQVANTQYSFDATGQAKVTLDLCTKGVLDMQAIRTNDGGTSVLQTIREINELSEEISRWVQDHNYTKPDGINREIRAFTVLEAAQSGELPNLKQAEVDEAIKNLRNMLASKNSNISKNDAENLMQLINKYFYPGSKDAKTNKQVFVADRIKKDASNHVKKKLDSATTGLDPFLPVPDRYIDPEFWHQTGLTPSSEPKFAKSITQKVKNVKESILKEFGGNLYNKYVSFGKLFCTFVADAVITMSSISEVQCFFYALNDNAGDAAGLNIAEFPINVPVFLDQYRLHVERQNSESITLEEFLKLAVDAQISDERSIAYGFADFFEPVGSDTILNPTLRQSKDAERGYESKLTATISGKGLFAKPQVEMFIETTHQSSDGVDVDLLEQFEYDSVTSTHKRFKNDNYRKIIRIHVFDKTATPHNMASDILRSDNTSGLLAKAQEKFKTFIDTLMSDNSYVNQDVKDVVASFVPTIVYGTNGSTIYNASISTINDQRVATVAMTKQFANKPASIQPNGTGIHGMPLRVIPAQLSVTSLGCPLLRAAQQYFFDFKTGTTIDNIYIVTGMTHTIVPGKFDSSLTLAPHDAYGKFEGMPMLFNKVKQQLDKIVKTK